MTWAHRPVFGEQLVARSRLIDAELSKSSRMMTTAECLSAPVMTQPPARKVFIMTMDPRQLQYLRTIVEAGTYREAAERLRVTQPMLSKSVKQLEHRLGVKLLTRGRHGAVPTVFGTKLVNWSKIIDTEFSKVLQDLDDIKGARLGHVRVGSVPPLTTRLFPQVISRMKAKHPGVLISLTEQSSRPLTESLLAGDFDLVVGGLGLDPVPPNIVEEFLLCRPQASAGEAQECVAE
jgi:DNA-binding transcriptional LysR family regulator